MAHWSRLDDVERARLEELVRIILVDKLWEASHGFELTEEIRVLVGALACLPILNLDYDYYHRVTSIIVSPGAVMIEGERHIGGGIHTDAPEGIIGQASYEGPVLIAWDATRQQARRPEQGRNVVFHEFAHKLDMLDGSVDGAPPMESSDQRRRWTEVCNYEYRLLCSGASGDLLDPYGAEDPGEFFAVATETFFCLPKQMAAEKPQLYEVFRDFYRQDPAAR
jgi:Mlc titration factor MtfA (ptsG expression regulator)